MTDDWVDRMRERPSKAKLRAQRNGITIGCLLTVLAWVVIFAMLVWLWPGDGRDGQKIRKVETRQNIRGLIAPLQIEQGDGGVPAPLLSHEDIAARRTWYEAVEARERIITTSSTRADRSRRHPVIGSGSVSPSLSRIRSCESGGDYRAVNPNGHYGAYQFSLSTWHSVGGTGNPIDAPPAEQDRRAALLMERDGPGQWECKG